MPMKKITFNALLNHKAYSYEPMQIEVEKIIPLYGKRFEQMKNHPLDDCPEIIENRELMYMEGNTAHCILFLDANGSDGILVEAEGADYARKSEFISNARAIIEQSEFTYGERQLHTELKAMADHIAELAHAGQKHFTFEEMLGDGNMKAMMIQAVAEFICKHGQYGDVRITTMEGKELLDTFGIYINKISDMEYREELLKVLIPMQHEVENAAFSDDEDMDETEDVDMTM